MLFIQEICKKVFLCSKEDAEFYALVRMNCVSEPNKAVLKRKKNGYSIYENEEDLLKCCL